MDLCSINEQTVRLIMPESINPEVPNSNVLPEEQLENNEITQNQPVPVQSEDEEVEKNKKVKGVIRNLLEGHFKGVADVRLRINFFDELSAMENTAIQKEAAEKIPDITDSVNADIEDLLSSENLSEEQAASISEQMEAFAQSVGLAKEDFLNASQPSKESLISGLNSYFEEFTASLNLVLLPPETEPLGDNSTIEDLGIEELITVNPDEEENDGINEIIEQDQAVGPETTFQDFIQNLRTTFAEYLNELTTALNDTKILPQLSEPNGNGRAYDKFVAIYNSLQGTTEYSPDSADGISVIV